MTRVNLITGFLGSGKTTTLRYLLANKPANERWAVLVNEFGEVGIDGALLAESGALLKEIPGGCMCCVNGLPMQVGLNMLLKQPSPDRLLIEPTGLGHPRQILTMLTATIYRPWIDLRATLCLLDPRQLKDRRAVENENFRDQLAAADIIVANKQDRWDDESRLALENWQQQHIAGRTLLSTEHGRIDSALLDTPRHNLRELPQAAHHHHSSPQSGLSALKPDARAPWRRSLNQGQGYYACGWVFNDETIFDTIRLLEWARLAPVGRVKGVLRTVEGTVSINRQGTDFLIETRAGDPPDSRIELISDKKTDWNELQTSLLKIRLHLPGLST